MGTFRLSQCQDGDEVFNAVNEDVRAQKDTFENLTHKRAHQEGFQQVFCQKILKILNLSQI